MYEEGEPSLACGVVEFNKECHIKNYDAKKTAMSEMSPLTTERHMNQVTKAVIKNTYRASIHGGNSLVDDGSELNETPYEEDLDDIVYNTPENSHLFPTVIGVGTANPTAKGTLNFSVEIHDGSGQAKYEEFSLEAFCMPHMSGRIIMREAFRENSYCLTETPNLKAIPCLVHHENGGVIKLHRHKGSPLNFVKCYFKKDIEKLAEKIQEFHEEGMRLANMRKRYVTPTSLTFQHLRMAHGEKRALQRSVSTGAVKGVALKASDDHHKIP